MSYLTSIQREIMDDHYHECYKRRNGLYLYLLAVVAIIITCYTPEFKDQSSFEEIIHPQK
jgi:hypothetical protein